MKRSFPAVSFICALYASIGFGASNPASMDWVKTYVKSQLAGTTYELFQHAQGGVIFYLDSSKKHGLVAATSDLARPTTMVDKWLRLHWSSLGELFQGFQNTTLIINDLGDTAPAASNCSKYTSTYSGWYLPASQELNQMYFLRTEIGGFTQDNAYWSSSEYALNAAQAIAQIFGTSGQQQQPADKTAAASVRCIRAF